MIRKMLLGASLGGMLLLSVPSIAQTGRAEQDQTGRQTQAETKQVQGKIASIGDDRRSFVLEVDKGGQKQNMNFVLGKNSQVEGRVSTGTMVLVEYQPANGDQNLVVKVSARG